MRVHEELRNAVGGEARHFGDRREGRGVVGAASLIGTIASAFSISQTQSTLEFFMSGSMAKVLTLLTVVGILMLRPQGLFVLKVRR